MIALNTIKDNAGARYQSKRVGRGIGSGKGKTSGSGHKGQRSRSGVSLLGFEGGQNPIYRRLPKRGFKNIFRKEFNIVNLGNIELAIVAGKLDGSKLVDTKALLAAGLISNDKLPVKLLSNGELKSAIELQVDKASKSAVDMVSKAKGKLNISSSK